ncbi:MAG: hypothetical protein HKN44_04800 [Ilumatobacter sp.]|nr:hypothetical protein [Ilumatobacter sp.]
MTATPPDPPSEPPPPPAPRPSDGGPAFGSAAPPPIPDATPADAPPDTHFRRHDTEATRTYPCDACGGELHFDIDAQLLKCAHCGTTRELREVGGTVEERDLREALELVRAGAVTRTAQFLDDEKEIVCQNCGGHTTFTGSLTATNCPYCATPIQRDDVHAAPERLPVDGVLPFTVSADEAKALIEKWINGRWFAPNEFKTYNRTGAFSSVYTAYFTYDADTFTLYTGRRGDNYTVTVGHGENRRTEVRTNWTPVRGSVRNNFDDITVFANDGFERGRVQKLEPWPTDDAQPYTAEYVAGHLCRTYDRDVEDCLSEATHAMEQTIRSTVRQDIGGDQQQIGSMDINWQRMTYKHLLLPMWLLTVIYMDRPFQVYINGVTGEVHGARPYSKAKIAAAIAVALVLLILIAVAVSAAGGG